ANKSKQGIGRRIVVGQAEVRSTSNHLNKAEALNARNTRGAVETQGTYHQTQTTKTQRGTRNKDYIYTQATDNEGQVRTIKAGQTDTGGLNKGNQQDTGETNDKIGRATGRGR